MRGTQPRGPGLMCPLQNIALRLVGQNNENGKRLARGRCGPQLRTDLVNGFVFLRAQARDAEKEREDDRAGTQGVLRVHETSSVWECANAGGTGSGGSTSATGGSGDLGWLSTDSLGGQGGGECASCSSLRRSCVLFLSALAVALAHPARSWNRTLRDHAGKPVPGAPLALCGTPT